MPTPTTRLSTLPPRENQGIEIVHQRSEKLFLKLALSGIFGFLLLIAVIWGGHRFYVRWQEKRLIRQADTALRDGDMPTASLAVRAVLQMKPDSLQAERLAALMAERSGDSSALVWRRKVVQDPRHTAEDVLSLANAALQLKDIATAKTAIGAVPEADRETGGYHAVAAMIADADNQTDKAAAEWEQAVRLSPQEKAYQLQLGATQFRSTDPSRHKSGQAILNGLRSDEKFRTAATRILINESIAQHETTGKILQLAQDLTSYPDITFADRIVVADIFRQANDPQFASFLTDLEKSALNRPQDLATLLSWMSNANLNVLALDFIRTLKPESLKAWPVPLTLSDIYVRLNEWKELETLTKAADWRGFEFLRHAYLARALREQDKPASAQSEWSTAIRGASDGSEQLMALLRLVSSWRWREEEIEVLWALTKHPEKEKDATQTLYKYYLERHDTHGLYRVLLRLAEEQPDNLDVQNNLAQVSLLLDSKTEDARRIAADVYQKHPDNAAYATTYAYALLTKGDNKGAAKVMGSLTVEQLKDPAVAMYYGICLATLNDPRAAQYLEAAKDGLLLPEEKTLLEKARSQIPANKNN